MQRVTVRWQCAVWPYHERRTLTYPDGIVVKKCVLGNLLDAACDCKMAMCCLALSRKKDLDLP